MCCGGPAKPFPLDAPACVRDSLRTSAVMCMFCPDREGTRCGLTTLTVDRMVRAEACPRGHHPPPPCSAGSEPVLSWIGLRWYGVPAPLRWLLSVLIALRAVRPLSGPLTGCGCIKPLRDRYDALPPRLRHYRAVARVAVTGRLGRPGKPGRPATSVR